MTYDAAVSCATVATIWTLWRARPGNIVIPGHDLPMVLRRPAHICQARGRHHRLVRRRHRHDDDVGVVGPIGNGKWREKVDAQHAFDLDSGCRLLVALTTSVAAQSDYPNRPLRLIIPFPPGGSNDVVGRMIGTQLGERLGKQVIVDNRAGAGGIIGTEIAAKAAPDGYTLCSSRWRTRSIRARQAALRPGQSGRADRHHGHRPACWWSIPPAGEDREGADRAGQEQARRNEYASAGVGSFQHLASELFQPTAKLNICTCRSRAAVRR